MDISTDLSADARNRMVDGQIRPNRVSDRRVLAAMRRLPRERFVPAQAIARAYADEDVPLGGGRMLLAPLSIARLVQLAAPRAGERALVVGCATGYGAALLAACGAAVTALDEDEALLAAARAALAAAGVADVTLVRGKLREGWPAAAPYDLVLIEGAAEEVPPDLAAQVRVPGGRLVGVLAAGGPVGRAVLAEPSVGGLSFQPAFDCAAPLLPPLRRGRGFVF
jgi:protein-L-isoaspartate(D-aspartate) O-methyltransferase